MRSSMSSCACCKAGRSLGHAPRSLFDLAAYSSRLHHRRPAYSSDGGGPRQKAAQDLRVAIIGAGIGGPVLAMLLKKHLGCTPVVFEQADAIREVGAGISFAPNGLRVLDSLGTSPSLAATVAYDIGEPIKRTVATRCDGSTIVDFPSMAEEKYGLAFCGVRRFRLLNLLLAEMADLDIPLQLGKRLVNVHQDDAAVTGGPPGSSHVSSNKPAGPAVVEFADGSSFEADLVVGCDGLRSHTRAVVKGSDEQPPTYTQQEVVFAVARERNTDITPADTCVMVYGPGQQHFGTYGLGAECCWFTSCLRPARSRDSWGLVANDEVPQIIQELHDKYQGWTMVERMLARDVAVMIRAGIFDRETPRSWSRGVVTLAGDAASPIPPNLGQGGNKALEDVAVLAGCLKKFQGDVVPALQLYEQLRSTRSADLLSYSRTASMVSNLQNPLAVAARNTMLKTITALQGTIPSDWMWAYDADKVLAQQQAL